MDFDVCVVGAGVAGALVAHRVASAGYSVLVLESGPRLSYPDPARYELLARGRDVWPWEEEARDAYEDHAEPRILLNQNRIKAVGGTTLHWNANAQRLQPGDFRMASAFGLGVDWPFDYETLEPWYLEAEYEMGVSGGDAPGHPPRSGPFPLRAFETSYAERELITPAFEAMGLQVGANTAAINSTAHDGRPACSVFSTCTPMCPIHAKYTGLHHIHKAEATGRVQVMADCHARRIRRQGQRQVSAVEYVDEKGQPGEARARCFVLAGGGVEIPRLLLLSSDGDGLANSSAQVGRNYMTHPRIIVKARTHEQLGAHRNGYSTTNCWTLYQHDRLPDIGNIMLSPDPNIGPRPADIARSSRVWGHDLLAAVKREYGQEMDIHVKGDMLPRGENRIELSSTMKDRFGDPVPAIHMHFSDFERRALDYGAEAAISVFQHMRAEHITPSGYGHIRNHLMGTTRMGTSAADSVCDQWGRCHDLDNLYVASSSLFPTVGCSSPTLTIAAVALRSADYLVHEVL